VSVAAASVGGVAFVAIEHSTPARTEGSNCNGC
jgi:hypothetical protein